MPIDPIIKKGGEADLKLPLDNPVIADALRRGSVQDVHKLLSDYGLTPADFEQFAAGQYSKYKNIIEQTDPAYEQAAFVAQPNFELMFQHQYDSSSGLTEGMAKEAVEMIGKSMTIGKFEEKGDSSTGKPGSDAGAASVSEWESFYQNVLQPEIVNKEFEQEYRKRSEELDRELQNLINRAKHGPVDAATVCGIVLAMTKTQMQKNGIVFTHLGRQMMTLNNQMNAAFDTLKGNPTTAAYYTAQSDIQSGSRGMQFITNDMNQITTNLAGQLQSAKSVVDAVMGGMEKLNANMAKM